MKIKRIWAKNFLAVGDKPLEIDFSKYGRIVNIRGKNGSGKSTCTEMISYALYGKLIRGLTQKQVINNRKDKNLEVGIEFDNYKIVRTRKPDTVRFWENGEEKTIGGDPRQGTQPLINKVVGMSYEAFISVACFGQHNEYDFLNCNPATKRSIVENLLSLEKYKRFQQTSKDKVKSLDIEIKTLMRQYEDVSEVCDKFKRNIRDITHQQGKWKDMKEFTIIQLTNKRKAHKAELDNSDIGVNILAYNSAQDKIDALADKITMLDNEIDKISNISKESGDNLELAQDKCQRLKTEIQKHSFSVDMEEKKLAGIEEEFSKISNLKEGVRCSHCYGEVSLGNCEHFKTSCNNKKEASLEKLSKHTAKINDITEQLEVFENKRSRLKSLNEKADFKSKAAYKIISKHRERTKELSKIQKPDIGAKELILQGQIKNIEEQIIEKSKETDPYESIFKSSKEELQVYQEKVKVIRHNIQKTEEQVPYYKFWIKGFGDDGIRSFIIGEVLPTLNARINYWLQFLIDNKIKLTFDNQLDESIESEGDPFVYHGTSGGERKRINLAVSQAFAYVMMLSSGTWPSIISLDEVATNMDEDGVQGIYQMICELAIERQVLIVTHDQKLLELLEGCDVMKMEKVDGHTTLVS